MGLPRPIRRQDLDGSDAAHKLVLAVKEAFGVDITPRGCGTARHPGRRPGAVRDARASGSVVRLVATRSESRRKGGGGTRPAAGLWPAIIRSRACRRRRTASSSRGSTERSSPPAEGRGRWPTAEAVVADVLDLWRDAAPGRGKRDRIRRTTVAVAAA